MKARLSIYTLALFCMSAQVNGACPSEGILRGIVDQAFDAGPMPVTGISAAVHKPGCEAFAHARGEKDVLTHKALTTKDKMHIGSLTKPVTGALALFALDQSRFGPKGFDAPVSGFLSSSQINKLSSNCSDTFTIKATDRTTGANAPVSGLCPDWTKVTIWNLIHANSGNISGEELDVNQNDIPDYDDRVLRKLVVSFGIPTFPAAPEPKNAFEVLDTENIYRHSTAVIGGNSPGDHPPSFGNTDYDLLGVVTEKAVGYSYNLMLMRIGDMVLVPSVPPSNDIAHGYMDLTGASASGIPDDFNGVYPLVDLRGGRRGIDLYNMDSWSIGNGAGGAGAIASSPLAYLKFFEKLTGGGLLSSRMQKVFNNGFVETGSPGLTHGFGVFLTPSEFGPAYTKSGALYGSYCVALSVKDTRATVVACVNHRDVFQEQSDPASSAAALVGDTALKLLRAQ